MGVNVNYAPVCDLATKPDNPALGIRSFGDDPAAVGKLAAANVRGLQDGGVAATAKHFPGAGDTDADPHLELPMVPRTDAELAEPGAGSIPGGAGGGRADGDDRPLRIARPGPGPADEPVRPRFCATSCVSSCASTA